MTRQIKTIDDKVVSKYEQLAISVIIPTYNCAHYICRAIDSVMVQGLKNIEIIVIDDLSSDNTRDILKKKYSYNPIIKLIFNEKNIKQGASRNIGMDIAKGKFIFFLDADDWIEPETLVHLKLIAESNHAEIVACGANKTWENKKKEFYHGFDFTCSGGVEALNHFVSHKVGSIIWNKLYLREFIEKHKLRFVENHQKEDVVFTMEAILACKRYVSISNSYYNYYQRDNSFVNSVPKKEQLISFIRLYLDIDNFLKNNTLYNKNGSKEFHYNLLKNHFIDDFISNLKRYKNSFKDEEWKSDFYNICYKEMGSDGFFFTEYFLNAMDETCYSKHALTQLPTSGLISMRSLVMKYFKMLINGRFRQPLRRIYYMLRFKNKESQSK